MMRLVMYLDLVVHVQFDAFLQKAWLDAMDDGHFKYRLDGMKSKLSAGNPTFIMQVIVQLV